MRRQELGAGSFCGVQERAWPRWGAPPSGAGPARFANERLSASLTQERFSKDDAQKRTFDGHEHQVESDKSNSS